MDRMLTDPARRSVRAVGRIALFAWAGFWAWFLLAHVASEPPAPQPWIGLALVGALSLAAWFRPRLGALGLTAAGVWAAWFFGNTFAVTAITLPAALIAIACWLGAPRSDHASRVAGSGAAR